MEEDIAPLPGLYVNRVAGAKLKSLIATNPNEATITLTGTIEPGITYNIIGILPGQTDDIVLITSHHDGMTINDALGAAQVMSIAKYLANYPQTSREKTMMFYIQGGHFISERGVLHGWQRDDLWSKILMVLNLELTACKEYEDVDGVFVETGLVSTRGLFISGAPFSINPTLLSIAKESIPKYDIDRTIILPASGPLGPYPPGLAHYFLYEGKTVMEFISSPAHQYCLADTPDKVMVEQLRPVAAAFIDILNQIDEIPPELLIG